MVKAILVKGTSGRQPSPKVLYGPWSLYQNRLTEIKVCLSNYDHAKLWDVITNPYPNINGGLGKSPGAPFTTMFKL